MIKIFTNNLRTFSTLRFPQKYKQAHQITYELRSCFSIKTLREYMEKQKQKIITFGKTETLQFLNQFPLNFNNGEIDFLLFATNFQNLNIYEELLRFSCIGKMYQYYPRDPYKFLELVRNQEDRLVKQLKDKQIDGVDGLNIIVQKSYFARDQLLNKALESIFNNDMTNYKNMISKCISIVLKRLEDINWCQVRKYHSFLSFLCYSYNSNHQDKKNLVQVLTRALSLQLHRLGYDTVPICITTILQKIQIENQILDFLSIQNAFEGFRLLPLGFSYKTYKFLLIQIKKRLNKSLLYPQKLPYERMTLAQINEIRQEYMKGSLNLINCIFYFNNPNAFFFIYDDKFMDKSYNYFVSTINYQNKKVIKTDYPAILAFAFKLYSFYFLDPKKVQMIKNLTKKMTIKFMKSQLLQEILSEMSICNLMNLQILQRQFQLFTNDGQRINTIVENIIKKSFNKQKNKTYFKCKAFTQQIQQILGHHRNTNDLKIKQTISSLIRSNYLNKIEEINSFDTDYIAHLTFKLQDSTNHIFFEPITDKVYQIYKTESTALAQLYVIYPYKTQRLTIRVINKIWENSPDFIPLVKILAYQWENIVTKEKQLDSSVAQILNECTKQLNKEKIYALSEKELQSLFKMCDYFGLQIKSFSVKFMQETFERISKIIKHEKINLFLLKEYLKVLNSHNIKFKEVYQLLKNSIDKIQQQTQKQYLSLQLYEIILQFSIHNKKYVPTSLQFREKIEMQINQAVFSFNNTTSLTLALHLYFSRKLKLNQTGLNYLKQNIFESLSSNSMFPFHLKDSIWVDLQKKMDFTLDQSQLLKDLVLFCLKQIKIQQGAAFYQWCLQRTHKLISLVGQDSKSRDIINETLELIPLFSIDSSLLNKILDILKVYPSFINLSFNRKVLNIMKIPNLNLNQSYLSILQYFNLIYYQIPDEIKPQFNHLFSKIQTNLLSDWEKVLSNTKIPSLNDETEKLTTKSYTYLQMAIKNNKFSPNTFKILDNFMKIYKKYEMKAFGKQNVDTNKLSLVNIYLNMELKNYNLSSENIQKIEKKPKFFTKTSQLKQKEQIEKLRKMKVQTFSGEKTKNILTALTQQFRRLNIKKSQKYLDEQNFYSFDFDYKGLKVFCFLKYGGKNYAIITKSKNWMNEFSLVGEHKLYQILYRRIFNLQALHLDPTKIQKSLDQIQQK